MEQPPREKCIATNRNGDRCGKWPMKGSKVCRAHGGAAPQVKAAAARRLETAKAEAAAVTFGLPVEVDPHSALLGEVHRAAGVVAWLTLQVRELGADEVVWGRTKEVEGHSSGEHGGDYSSTEEGAAVHQWVQLLGQWSDRLVRVAKAAIDAGVSERLVKLEEERGRLIADLLARVIDDPDAGLSPDQRQGLRVVAARHLRALPAA